MNKIASVVAIAALAIVAAPRPASAGTRPPEFQVVPFERNDALNLVRSTWQKGIGCANNSNGLTTKCRPDFSDTDDKLNQGLLLAKSGDTLADPGQAGATLVGIAGQIIPSDAVGFAAAPILGYDIRRDILYNQIDAGGSHCGANPTKGSPRFEVQVGGNWYYIPCGAPALIDTATPIGWTRLRWPAAALIDPRNDLAADTSIMGQPVQAVQIVFDAGPDPVDFPNGDSFGLAVLDNIFAWNRVEGDGNVKPAHPSDEDEGAGEDKDHNSCQYRHSDSQPDRNKVAYSDKSQKMQMSSTNIRSATYQANCVNLVGDALVNGKPGYTYTYQACDLSTGLTPGIGTFNMAISGPGFAYSKSAPMTSGFVYIHPHL